MAHTTAHGSAIVSIAKSIGSTSTSSERDKEVNMITWKKREAHVRGIPKANKPTVPLIVKPLQLPRHTYKQVRLELRWSDHPNLIYVYLFKKKQRIAILKRSFTLDL